MTITRLETKPRMSRIVKHNGVIYLCGQVCKDCAIEIINAGIKTLVYLEGCNDYDSYSSVILEESGIKVRKVKL